MSSEQPPSPPPIPSSAPPPRAKTLLWVWVLFLLALNAFILLKSCLNVPRQVADKLGQAVERAAQSLTNLVAAFNRGRVTTEFLSYATSVQGTHYLQFATLKQTEIFTRTDESSTAFGYVPLPEVIVEARAPVEYTYYLDLQAPWQLRLENGVVQVLAPPIRFNTPAVDPSAITYEVRKGSVLRDTAGARDNLKNSITSLVKLRARENISLIRENGRRATAEFVEKWLMQQFPGGPYPVRVLFPGELAGGTFVTPRPENK